MIEAVGADVGDLRVGMRAGYMMSGNGAYATHVTVPAAQGARPTRRDR